jgi:uncharacterized protein YndB with AHSA1/START domain
MKTKIMEEIVVKGSCKEVWGFITEPIHFQSWYAFGGASIDLRPDGLISMKWDEHGVFEARIEKVIQEKLFSFQWLPESSCIVQISLQQIDDGKIKVQIEESGDLEDPVQSALAWRNGLNLLLKLCEKQASK